MPPQETRAEIARRRLAQLTETFEAAHASPRVGTSVLDGRRELDEDVPRSGGDAAERLDDAVEGSTVQRRAAGRPPGRRRAEVVAGSRLHPSHLRVLATLAVGAGVVLTWWLLAERPRAADVEAPLAVSARADTTDGAASAEAPAPGGPTEVVVVDVAGKVRKPGIVTLPAGSRVYEAIEKAGGATGDADGPSPNLARVLVDGEQILVGVEPAAPDAAVAGQPPSGTAPSGGLVDLNTATLEQLDTLPGVGPVTAAAIVDWRTENGTFGAVDDLLDVSGIGEKTLEQLRDLVTV